MQANTTPAPIPLPKEKCHVLTFDCMHDLDITYLNQL